MIKEKLIYKKRKKIKRMTVRKSELIDWKDNEEDKKERIRWELNPEFLVCGNGFFSYFSQVNSMRNGFSLWVIGVFVE